MSLLTQKKELVKEGQKKKEEEVIQLSCLKEGASSRGGGRRGICVNSRSDESERIHYCCQGIQTQKGGICHYYRGGRGTWRIQMMSRQEIN